MIALLLNLKYQLAVFVDVNVDKITIMAVAFAVLLTAIFSIFKIVGSFGKKNRIHGKRIRYIVKLFSVFLFIGYLIFLLILWGINYKGIFVFASSIFTVVGVGLFATWSVLSNFVSSVIIFFGCPYKIGDAIRIVDGDNSLEGTITDINFYNVILEDKNCNIITYPNNVILQKAVIRHMRKEPA